jgi:hypothetical protein
MNSINKTARMAGLFYIIYIIASVVADLFGHFVFADVSTTVNHMMTHQSLFSIGVVISLFAQVFFLLAAWYLYILLRSINKNIALLFLLLNLGGFVIMVYSHTDLFSGLMLLSGADYLKVFQPDQLQAQATFFINSFHNGSTIAQIPFGVWLFPLGYLVFKSGFLPKILGILLIIDCFTLLLSVFQHFLLPNYEVIAYPAWVVGFIAEFGLALWLLIKGVKEQQPILSDGHIQK